MSFKDALKRDWDNSVLKRLLVGKGDNPTGQVAQRADDDSQSEAVRTLREKITTEILDKLELPDKKKEPVMAALDDVIRMADVLIRRAPEIELDNSSTFGRKRDTFAEALRSAGTKKADADNAVQTIVSTISTILKEAAPKQESKPARANAGTVPYERLSDEELAALQEKRRNDDPPALEISNEQVQQAAAKAMEAANALPFPDEAARERFQGIVTELVERRAAMLRFSPSQSVERYDASEKEHDKRGELIAAIKQINPDQPHANQEILNKMYRAMDSVMGWER